MFFYLLAFPPSPHPFLASSGIVKLAVSRIHKPFGQIWLNLVEFKSHQEGKNYYGEGKDMQTVEVHTLLHFSKVPSSFRTLLQIKLTLCSFERASPSNLTEQSLQQRSLWSTYIYTGWLYTTISNCSVCWAQRQLLFILDQFTDQHNCITAA